MVCESGIAASSLSWTLVAPEIAKFARVIRYDRAGLGYSDRAGGPVSLPAIVADLRAVLSASGVLRPCILVGHSFGGLIVRAYAAWYPEEVAGLLLLDPVLPSEWSPLSPARANLLALGFRLSRRGAWLASFGVVRFSLWLLVSGARWLPQLIARLSSGSGSSVIGRLAGEVGKLPPAVWPSIQAHWSDAKSFRVMASYFAALPASAGIVAALPDPVGIPVTIVSAGNATLDQKREWDRLASRANPGAHIVAQRSGHWIPFDEPQLVVDMICRMQEQVATAPRKE